MTYCDERYIAPQQPHCKYFLAPLLYLQEEEGEENTLQNAGMCLSAVMRRFRNAISISKERHGLRLRVMFCEKEEGKKVGYEGGTVRKLEVSYPAGHISRSNLEPPSDEEALEVARMMLPNHPQCHKLV